MLLDVREPEEFAAGHAPTAVHVPLGELERRLDELGGSTVVVCVCRSGVRSAAAAGFLRANGRDARNLTGGMLAWAAEGLAVTTPTGDPGTVL